LRSWPVPRISDEAVGPVDAVLLSHDQHSDNLDNSGKDFLVKAKRVLTNGCRRQAARRSCRRPGTLGDHGIDRQETAIR